MNEQGAAEGRTNVEFSGRGGEYFRIWIVNLALTIVTLGIYSAWAKVRRLQYFYRNTSFAGSAFDYHGDPLAILKGRLIGVALLVTYNVVAHFSVALGIAVFLLLLAALPWLVQRSICFKLANSSYRGLRFRFNGDMTDAYKVFLGWTLLGYLSLGLLFPLAHQRMKAYLHNHSALGDTAFRFSATPRAFYMLYLKLLGLILVPLILVVALAIFSGVWGSISGQRTQGMMMAMSAVLVFYVFIFAVVGPWFSARLQNLVWNHTTLGEHALSSDVQARRLFVLYLTNFLGIVVTLGLFKPFADIRLARYRLTCMAMTGADQLDALLARDRQAINATGEETAEVFDVDISF